MIMSRYNKQKEIKNIYHNNILNSEMIKALNKNELIELVGYLENYTRDIINDFIDYRDN